METPFGMAAMSAFSMPGPRTPAVAAPRPEPQTLCVQIAGIEALLDPTGALYWPAERLLVVSDLHLETGSSYARFGQMLPPYDTRVTLAALFDAVARHRPERVLSLGDTFHDRRGVERLLADDRAVLDHLFERASFIWVSGNHEGDSARALPGEGCESVTIAGVTFRHIPDPAADGIEVAGHLHPAAHLVVKGRTLRRRAFVGCGRRLVMPAFGCLTGGLSVADAAFRTLWPNRRPNLHLCGRDRVYAV